MSLPVIAAAVEGDIDEAVVEILIEQAGGQVGTVYGKVGKAHLRQKIQGYNNAARFSLWMVLVDLDHEEDCAPRLRERWLSDSAPNLCFRVAVREVEAWLLADADTLASYLSVARSRMPSNPEQLRDPKGTIVDLARRSRRREIREGLVPRIESRRDVGPTYTSQLVEYVKSDWRPDHAARRSGSLHQAIRCLRRIVSNVAT